jgi:hypothetical protein
MSPQDEALVGEKNSPMMPLAWAREFKMAAAPQSKRELSRRTVCTTLGASQDFESSGLRRLLVNSTYWCLELEHLISSEGDVEYVTEYDPTPFGHGSYQRGLKPSDLNLKK